jgi:hypothetical protein
MNTSGPCPLLRSASSIPGGMQQHTQARAINISEPCFAAEPSTGQDACTVRTCTSSQRTEGSCAFYYAQDGRDGHAARGSWRRRRRRRMHFVATNACGAHPWQRLLLWCPAAQGLCPWPAAGVNSKQARPAASGHACVMVTSHTTHRSASIISSAGSSELSGQRRCWAEAAEMLWWRARPRGEMCSGRHKAGG